MSEAAAIEIFEQRGKSFPMDQEVDGESNKLTNSDFEPVSSNFTDSSGEKTSILQPANTTSKATPPFTSSDGSESPASFERWCVDCYPKFYTLAYEYAYYCLFLPLSILLDIIKFIRIPWTVLRHCTSFILNPWLVGAPPTHISPEPFSHKRENLQQTMQTVPAPIDSISSISGTSWTFRRNFRASPQTLEKKQPSSSQRAGLLRRLAMGTGCKDTVSLISGKSSTHSQNGRGFQQTIKQEIELRVQRLRALNTGHKDDVPMVCVRRTTNIVEKSVSARIRPTESIRTGSFSPVTTVQSRFTKIVEDFLPSSFFSRRNVQNSDGRRGKLSTSKHGFRTGEKASSSNTFLSENSRRHPHAGINVASRTNNTRKVAIDQSRTKHGSKTEEKAFSSKQCQNTKPRREERNHGSNKAEAWTHNKKKGASGQTMQKNGPKKEEKTSSGKKRQNMESRREERGPRAGNTETRSYYDACRY